MTYSEFESSVR